MVVFTASLIFCKIYPVWHSPIVWASPQFPVKIMSVSNPMITPRETLPPDHSRRSNLP